MLRILEGFVLRIDMRRLLGLIASFPALEEDLAPIAQSREVLERLMKASKAKTHVSASYCIVNNSV